MCAATASPAAASSGPGGDGFFPAATISSSPAPGALFMPLPEGSLAAAGLGLGLPAPDSRGHYQLLLSGRALADRYRRIYTAALSDRDQGGSSAGHPASRNKKILNKKKLKRKQKSKSKVKTRSKSENLENTVIIPDIKLHSNPSAFNIYCNVRHCVLEWQKKETSLAAASKNSVQSGESDSDEEEESKEPPIKLPKIIEVGLCEVFELIKETRFSHPSLCLRSLQALLNVLQGQQPEGLQSEPPEVLESLFQLLLEITVRSTGMNDSTGQSLTALSCACLFSLVASWGETGRTLQAISAILTNNGSHACQTIQVPMILNSLQRSVQAVLVGKIQIQDWFSNGIKKAALMHKWPLKEISVDEDDQCLLQNDGFFLYLLCKDGLYKIGSGYSGTVRGYLLYRDVNNHSMTAIRISPETLEQDGTVLLPDCHTEGQNILFTDGEYINQIAASRDDGFVVRIFATSTEPVLQQELQLKLARKCLHACGISLFDLEKDLHIISTGFDEESAVLGAGREFALMKTANGKIYYTGKYQSLGIKQGGPSAGKWVELPITKSPKIVHFSVGHDGSHALLVAEDGSIFFTGSASKGEDGESSLVTDLKGHFVTQVAMGKAHTCVLMKNGEVWTFGVNNKGQCGRDTGAMNQGGKGFGVENMATAMDEDLEEELDEKDEKSMMCPPGMHKWKLEQCMVCTVCGDCTGYGASCVSSGRPDRVPGGLVHKYAFMYLYGKKLILVMYKKDGSGERGEKDASKITTYPPGSVRFDCELRAVQVSCGFHHSVVLMENGDVYTFGYGQHGQLGHGDVNSRGCPTLVQALPGPSTQVTAGSNHTAALLMDGQKGQLGRPILDVPYWNAKPAPMPNIGSKYGRKATWIGASGDQTFLRIDEALINSHVLATSEIFASKHIIGLVPASISEPPPFKCLLINKVDGSCKTFNDSEQEDLQGFGVCLDPVYDVIWRFRPSTRELWCYNAVVADARLPSAADMQSRCSILSPELALPTGSRALTTRSHAALHILGCLDTLATMQDLKMGVASTEEETQAVMKVYSKEDYSVVNRFESHGGGWGYSAHSVEAIRFSADTDILLGGLGLFGGRGEYTAKIKLFELGPDGGDHETDGDLLAETDVLAYDCAAREKYAMMFDEPVLLQAGWWYVAWARVSGPSSDCGSHGQASITTDDGVVFQFKSSKKSNNGTDVNAGQIPQLLYRLPTSDGSASKGKQQTSEPVHILKRSFARTVSVNEENISGMTSFREVLEKMLVIVVLPVRNSLRRENELFSSHLVSNTCGLLASIVSELTASALGSEVDGLNSLHSVKASANRFTKTSQGRSWNTGNGSPDAICFSVDKPGIVVVGFSVYGGGGIHEYELEVLVDDENVKYAVRLRNYGSRTANGDGGMTTVQCPDGVTFTFSTCSLSSNGTNQTRGQIPQILYYRSEFDGDLQSQLLSKANEEDKNCSRALSVVSTVVRAAKDLLHRALAVDADDIPELLSSSSLFSMLLPLIIAYIGPVAAAIPKVAVEVFGLVQQLLPSVAILNQKYAPPAFNPNQSTDSTTGNQPEQGLSACTTSNHYAVIESEHPYKPACVMHYKTASDYVKDDKASFYGFKCFAIGYEFSPGPDEGVIQLEKELANLGGVCAAALMKKDLALPIGNELEEDLEILEEAALQVCKTHSGILGKGLALSHSPTILEALEGNLPLQIQSNEQSFLDDFIACVPGSSGGRLARWLQPDSYADPQKTSLILNKDDIRCGWPTTITVQTKDQYGDVVHVPNMKVEVKAVPVSQKKTSLQQEQVKKPQRIPGSPAVPPASSNTDMTFGGLASPKLDVSYEPMIVKEARYIAITMMKVYENYSFEELRFASPTPKRPSENMLIRVNNDGTYCANWTPGAIGLYTIHVTIDGIEIDAGLEVKVKDPPKGMIPPGTQLVKPKTEPQPNKVRKFVAKDSAGLRIRSHPSLQSEQIGIVKVNGTITFIDEIHNDDGVWLRLNDETIKKYVPNMNGYTEAWCLSFNQHLGKSLLVPVDEPKTNTDDFFKDINSCCPQEAAMQEQDMPFLRGGPGMYKVVKTGPSGHNIRSCPNLREQVLLDQNSQTPPPSPFSVQAFNKGASCSAQGFDYGLGNNKGDRGTISTSPRPVCTSGKPELSSKHSRTLKPDGRMSRTTADQKKPRGTEGLSASESLMLKSDAAKLRSDSHSRSLSPNHNTLQTLKSDGRMSSGFRAESPGPGSRSSSPKPKTLPANRSSPSGASSPRSSSPHDKNLPQKSTAPVKTKLDPPRERSKSDSYTLDPDTLRKKKMPLTEPLRGRSTSPKPKPVPKDSKDSPGSENRAPSPHVVQENLHSEVVEVCTSSTLKTNSLTDSTCDESSEFKSVDEGSNKVHFSIGKAPLKEEQEMRASPKISRKCANRHTRPKKEKSSFLFKGEGSKPLEPAKQAMSPSVAECARAVFASFLWHEGIVHDAMACSSFLKFNPDLSKEHAPIRSSLNSQQPTEEKETKLKNRHSLEISSALNMFNIAPHGPDISKMGSINKNKVLSMLKEPPLHEKCEDGKAEATFEMSTHHATKSKSPLPLTLQHLVAFWEDISLATIKAASQNMIFPSPGSFRPRGNLFGEMAQLAVGGPEKDTICELCGESHPYPVTYHMRQAHPGCGRYAGGQGYNSIGHFCGGWAGNCGDGGIGGSTWYLVCDRCREKYLREKQAAAREKVVKQSRRKPMQVKTPRALPTMEAHQVIKANALFLLSLSSAAEPSILCYHPAKPFQSQLPSVKEGISEDLPVKMPCLYLQTLARHHHENFVGYQDDNLFQDEMRYLRSTSVPAPYISVTPDASPNVFEEPESNMKSMPPSLETSPITDTDLAKRTVFQRSYSVVASEYDKQHSILPARVKAIPRRRVNSGDAEVGSSLLRHPSPELSRLISAHSSLSKGERNFQWPVLAFVIQHHDLEGLEIAMKQALRKSACRVFAMEAFNWLLCNVIQTTSLHDILWHFVASLTPAPVEPEEEEDEENKTNRENAEQEKDTRVCEHPLSDIVIAGEAAHPLPHTFHRLLQTISDLMMSLPSGSSLQQMALRCWSLKFKQSDHQFLHQSNVFHHINNILSKSDDGDSEESFSISIQSGFEAMSQELCIVMCLKDLTSIVDIKTSSRPAMIGSLTDGSTETFWESGDEDKNKTKNITINCVKGINARYVSVHVDNSRDLGNKVTSMTFLTGKAVEDLCRIKQVDLDSRHIGWVTSELPGGDNHIIKIELKGPENTLRVRQVKVLGWKDGESTKIAGQISASVAQQRNCEAETLRVFRLITSQVFGKLISGDAEPTPEQEEKALLSSPEGEEKVYNATSDADLKEHMVGIIFSRSKLTNLQKQVCAHIVQAIRMEATRVREEWEHAISSKENANSQPNDEDASSDAYCFELLSMVLALSGSNVGRQYLAQQLTLLQDLFSLLHTASPRVQRQVTSLLRRVLPEVTPNRLASIIGVKSLPPADISDIIHSTEKGDWNKLGILDMFLGCIAKALTVQLKAKGTTITGTAGTSVGKGVTTVTLPMIFNSSYIRRGESHWWMKGSTPTQISEIIIKLVKDMAAGHLSEAWSRVTKNAIAETIIALTKMEEEFRSPVRCIATTRLWLALASLCVLDQDHVDRLSSGRWMGKDGQQKQMPMCDNHDDGETAAIILCNVCGNLCTDCDRFLHLHRRTKTHQRQVFKEEEEAIKVDLHEGCGRTKLFWLMALADSKTMKAMVEFREHTGKPTTSSSEACRFCGSRSGTELSAVGSVCSDADCQEYAKIACSKTHPCGHPCGGVKNEEHCLPCLHGCDKNATTLKQDADDMCMICFTEALSAAPAIQLDCSHVFHLQCCRRVLENRWLGPRITFGFISCPICKNKINHIVLKDLLDPIKELYEDVRRKALMRLEYEGLHKSEAITTPGVRFYNDPAGYAMNRYAYYVCYKCRKAYFGGEARCDAEAGQGDDYDPRELICGACSDVSRAQMCPKHGTDFLEYKCRYCCSVAVFFCFGTTHFCNACHDDFQRMTSIPKEELPHCPAALPSTVLLSHAQACGRILRAQAQDWLSEFPEITNNSIASPKTAAKQTTDDPGEGHGRRETEEGGFSPGSQSRKGGAALASPRRPALRMRAERGGPRRREREARGLMSRELELQAILCEKAVTLNPNCTCQKLLSRDKRIAGSELNRVTYKKRMMNFFLNRMKRGGGRDSGHDSSEEGIAEKSKRLRTASEHSQTCDWGNLLQDIVLQVFKYLPLLDRAHASQVCRNWNQVFHMPDLWRCFEFELNQPATSYLKATHPELIKQIIKRHSNHLQYVSFKVDSSKESAEAACDILSQLVNCSLKTLGLISTARPSFMDLPKSHFISALTVVFVNSKSLSSLKIDDTPVDDPSLKVLVANNSDTLKLLKMSSCPHVSPAGILCVADQCHGLRELALNYHLLSDELLLALSSEKHVRLEHLRIDVVSENPGQTHFHTIQKSSWDAFIRHSPKVNLVMYFFLYEEEFDPFFRYEIPATHLYFGRSVSKDVLGRVGMTCPRLVELVVCANGLRPLDEELIRIAERCKNLSAIGLGECEVSCSAFVEFVKMCGGRLSQLSIMEEVLIPDQKYSLEQIHWEVSKHLGRVWFPDMMPTW
ncbi:hypothetical protein E5288_WYG018908 [Bos mutus]|nr:hypothetical protein [Bos mutus]